MGPPSSCGAVPAAGPDTASADPERARRPNLRRPRNHRRRPALCCPGASCSSATPASGCAELPDVSVDCVITSPPYFGLRDYGVGGQLGTEGHIDDWAKGLLDVARELTRLLKPTGAWWLNQGDGYSRHLRAAEGLMGPGAGAGRSLPSTWR